MNGATACPPMNLGVLRFDRSAAVVDGRVRIPQVNVINLPGGKASVQGFLSGALDAAEVPLARYVSWKHQGMRVAAVPVFTDRISQHEYIYTRPDTGIQTLADLRGRRVVCAPSYFSTPSFWHRAILREECGIEPGEIHWHSTTPEASEMTLPKGVDITVSPSSILGLERLLDGTADCLMTARTPFVPASDRHRVKRVLADAADRQRAWFRRTGFFPIVHVIAIHLDALAARPELGRDICRAYDLAKAHCYRVLQDERMTGMPLMRSYLDDTLALCGDDPWPYGVAPNRPELAKFLELARIDGLIDGPMAVDDLFDPLAATYDFESRMLPGTIMGTADGGWAPESVPSQVETTRESPC